MSDGLLTFAASRSFVSPQLNLSLSDDAAIEHILSDIPFFCVGIMAFGVFTFFLILKRTNLLATYLYSSIFLAFAAAILDLSQVLARGRFNVDNGIDAGTAPGLIIAREISLSLSKGFIVIFFWGFVAEPARSEQRSTRSDDESLLSFEMDSHSASWERLGMIGVVMKYGLLLLITAIPLLQIVWRLAPRFNSYSSLYLVESALEIAVSVGFIMKLILNICVAESTSWKSSLASYIGPLIALLITMSVGIGNAVLFSFSETTLGRFLQAVALYDLILFILIVAFRTRTPPPAAVQQTRPRSSFQGLGNFHDLAEKTRESVLRASRLALHASGEVSRPSIKNFRRQSSASRLSSWRAVGRTNQRPSSGQEPLWSPDKPHPFADKEVFNANASLDNLNARIDNGGGVTPEVPDLGKMGGLTVPSSRWTVSTAATKDVSDIRIQVEEDSDDDDTQPELRSVTRQTDYSLASYYATEGARASSPALPPTIRSQLSGSESPIYGLTGIVVPPVPKSPSTLAPPPQDRPNSETNSFDELLRQQQELDNSIAALRLFSVRDSSPSLVSPKADHLPPSLTRRSVSDDSHPMSASARSEFSLSNFPVPPAGRKKAAIKQDDESNSRRESILPPRTLPSQVPTSTSDDSLLLATRPFANRLNSEATQYDVTSFIVGDSSSSVVDQHPVSHSPIKIRNVLSDVESGDDVSTTPSIQFVNEAQTRLTGPQAETLPSKGRLSPQPQLKPLLLGNNAPEQILSPNLTQRTLRNPVVKSRLPMSVKPRPVITGPRSYKLTTVGPRDAYERPRPPPAIVHFDEGGIGRI